MPYSHALADRVRDVLARRRGFIEKKMFGGVASFLNGNICVGIWGSSLIARVGPDEGPAALKEPFVEPFAPTGKAMTGWVLVAPDGIDTDEQLKVWIERAISFAKTLPAK
jgi:hypothetical protein